MRLARKVDLWIGFLVIVSLVMLAAPSFATDRDHDEGDSIDVEAEAESKASAHADAEGGAGGDGGSTGPIDIEAGGQGGGATVNTSSENTSLVLSGARDTADCFTKVGIGAEGFGLFWSRSDSFCKKVRLIASKIDQGNYAAAARLECTLPEWEEVYGHKKPRDKQGNTTPGYQLCLDDLTPTGATDDDGEDVVGHVLTFEEYDELIAQAASAEEVEEYVEQSEYRYAQQTNKLEAQDEELERLKREAAELKAAQKADEERVNTRQQALTALYEKRVAQDKEPDDDE